MNSRKTYTFMLDEETMKEFKIKSIGEGKTQQRLLEQIIKDYLKKSVKQVELEI